MRRRLDVAAVVLLLAGPANAHSWYAPRCCSDRDCQPVPCDDLAEREAGSVEYTPLSKIFKRSQVFASQDSRCHVCLHGSDQAPICAYTQQSS